MNIVIITPAQVKSLSGNRATANRWAKLLKKLGHKVNIETHWDGKAYDIMIALHAWRSAESIKSFHNNYPNSILIVALTGTDAYRFIHSHTKTTLHSIQLADHLIGLHDLIANTLPEAYKYKVHVIYQSAKSIPNRKPVKRSFRVCVAGHLRDEKDPLRPAIAVRNLPNKSKIEVHQYGKAHTSDWADLARNEMVLNKRYQWHQEIPHYKLRQIFQQSHLLVLPSKMEGGANVISEAIMAGLPIISSDIEGSVGLLGKNYPGYYNVGNEIELRKLLLKAEQQEDFYKLLIKYCNFRRELFSQEKEQENWQLLLHKCSLS